MSQFHFDPGTYLDLMHAEIPGFDELQALVAETSARIDATSVLDLGTGTGETARRVLALHARARLTGIDESQEMLEAARRVLPFERTRLIVQRIEDPLPEGPFDLAVSALAIHHLEGDLKADLFERLAAVMEPDGLFVMADVVVPADPLDAVIPLSPDYDLPSSETELLTWLRRSGFEARTEWAHQDLAVISASRP